MEMTKRVIISRRNITARYRNGEISGFRINIPASFKDMIEVNRKYRIILELEQDEVPSKDGP